jgi:hypothetical protein
MLVGIAIREKGFTTYVAAGQTCASSCGIAWLAGTKRAMSQGAQIGFHAIYDKVGYETRDNGRANALLGNYLTQLGLSPQAIIYLTRASGPNNLEWFTPQAARSVGIDVIVFESNGTPVTPTAYAPLLPSGFVPASVTSQPARPAPASPDVGGPPGRFLYRSRPFNRVHLAAFVYPPGWAYRRWVIGAALPPLFLAPAYYYSGWAAQGLSPPEPGFQWVRYGPDLLFSQRDHWPNCGRSLRRFLLRLPEEALPAKRITGPTGTGR